jgi:hypothetical protein
MVPVSGSAYTYSYMSPLGIDLDYWLGLNHGICNWNITVAISWSDYFTGLLDSGGIHLPQWVQMDYLTASTGYRDATALCRVENSMKI